MDIQLSEGCLPFGNAAGPVLAYSPFPGRLRVTLNETGSA